MILNEASKRRAAFVGVAWCCAAVVALSLAVLIATWGSGEPFALAVILAAFFVAAEHRDRVYSDETGLSGSIAVGLSAAIFLGARGWVIGAFFVCAAGGFYLPHIRVRSWGKIVVNMACFGLSGVIAALGVHLVVLATGLSTATALLLATIPAVALYWVVNSLLLGLATASLGDGRILATAWELMRSETVMLVFAVGGALCGLVMVEVGRWTGVAALVALLVAVDVFVISVPAGPTTIRTAWRTMLGRVAGAAVSGVVGAAIPKLVASAVVGALVGGVIGLAAGLGTVTILALIRLRISGTHIERTVFVGFVIAEVALPAIGTVSGVVGAFAGLGPAIATAAGLVVGAAVVVAWRRRSVDDDPVDDDYLLAAVTEAMFDGLPHPANRS